MDQALDRCLFFNYNDIKYGADRRLRRKEKDGTENRPLSHRGTNHALGHAHIWEGNEELASVSREGLVLAGDLSRKALEFVIKHLPEITKGIDKYYYRK